MAESKFADISFGSEEGEEEDFTYEAKGSSEDVEFDTIVGALEEILLDEEFSSTQSEFCHRHCGEFDDRDENRIEYTLLFEEYTALIEGLINRKLSERIPGFSMASFEDMVSRRQDEIGGEIFDLLLSLADFGEFKDMMLSHRKAREEQKDGDTLMSLAVSGTHVSSP